MFKSKSKKILTLALCGLMATGIMGTSVAQADFHNSPPAYQPYDRGPQDPPPEHHRHHENHDNNDQNVAGAVVVGAVIGAVIAKNT